MAKLTSKNGKHTIETDVPREIVTLKSQGYRVEPAAASTFDPNDHKVEEVLGYLGSISPEDPAARDAEVDRVLSAERAGKARRGVLEATDGGAGTPAT